MRKSFNLIWMVFGFLLLIVGCNEDKKSTAFDPNQPVKFTEFMPDSGGIRTKFIVKGSNFGEDKSQVKVYFKDEVGNEREALVLGVKPDVIYAQVPKQAGGESHVRVEIAGKEAELSNAEKTFKYIVTSSSSITRSTSIKNLGSNAIRRSFPSFSIVIFSSMEPIFVVISIFISLFFTFIMTGLFSASRKSSVARSIHSRRSLLFTVTFVS